MSWIKQGDQGIILKVKVLPKATRAGLLEIKNDFLKIAVNSPPVKGQANKECLKLISKAVGLPKSRIELISGESDRYKIFRLNTNDMITVRDKILSFLK